MTFKQLISRNYRLLLKSLDLSHEFVGGLQLNEAIQHKIAFIKEKQTPTDKVDALLSAMLEVSDDFQDSLMDDVIEALNFSGQGHVANIFRRVSDKVCMSNEHCRRLQTKMTELCKCMDPENQLLDQLLSDEVVSSCEVERIRFSTGRNEMTRKLIEIFMKKSDDAFETLTDTLNEVGQAHVAYILTGEGNARPLNQKLRDKLLLNRVELITSIYFKGLVSVLMSKGVFTEYDQQCVEPIRMTLTENEKIEKTLDLVARKSQSAFRQFIVALDETQHGHVVSLLMGSEIEAKVMIDTDATEACATNLEKELFETMQVETENEETAVKELNDALDAHETSFTGVTEGSIVVKFRCKNAEALRELYRSKTLDKLFTDAFCRPLAHKGLKSIRLEIADRQFQRCDETLAVLKLMTPEHRDALMSSAKFLAHKMIVSDDLLDKLALCGERRRAIETAAREERVSKLLDIVSRQPDSAFTQLLDALRDTEQEQSALILCTAREEKPLPQRPEAAWKMAKDSMRLLISKFQSIDDETRTAVDNLHTSLSTMRQMCGKTAQRTQEAEIYSTELRNVDACHDYKSLEMTEAATNGRISAKQPMPVPRSTQTSLEKNKLIVNENHTWMAEILPSGERVYGVTSLHKNLFVLRADRIDVYTTTSDYALLDSLSVDGLKGHEWNDLTSSAPRSCLYVADCAKNMIRALELGGSVQHWDVPECPSGVSVTPDNVLLVTCADSRQLFELNLDDGERLRHVELSADIQRPLHAVKLTTGHYVVSHSSARGLHGQHRVCVVDFTGSVLHSYGAQAGSGAGRLDLPCHLTIDNEEFVFVADSSNKRIVLLSRAMQSVREYVGSLSHPRRLHLERATRRLYISEFGGRVVVVELNDCSTSQCCSSVRLLAAQCRSSA